MAANWFSLFSTVLLLLMVVVHVERGEASGYDPTGRIYPWPLPTDRQPLFFGLIVSFGETFNSSGVVPGVNVALDIINSNESQLLDGYSLHYVLSDSQCSRTTALDVFFDQILSDAAYQKLAIIGAGCSLATEPTAEISHQFNITQLSCASTSPVLSDRERFRKYFQLLPSMADIVFAYVGVFKHFSWRQVVMIVQEENLFTEMTRSLKEQLTKNNISYTEYSFSSSAGLSDLQEGTFTNESERIYLFATFENYGRALLCEAFRHGIRYPTHLLLTFQWYEEQWWLMENDGSDVNLTCSGEERESVLQYSLAFNFILVDLLTDQDITTEVGITGDEYTVRESRFIGTPPYYFNRLPCAQYCFDATLSLAYALNDTLRDIMDSEVNARLASVYDVQNGTFRLEDFNYGSDALTNITFTHLKNTSFDGVTGKVSLKEDGVRVADYLTVHQFRRVAGGGLDWVRIGVFVLQEGSGDYVLKSNSTLSAIWPNGVPVDGIPNEHISTVSIALVVVIYIFAAAGIIFALVCLSFNFIFRNKKLVRLSSPKLNYITVLGTIVLYLSIVLFAIPTPCQTAVKALCIARLWFLSLGVSLAFGTIIMKMFRVYIIFRNPSPKKKKFINDWVLASVILLLVVLDLIVLISFTAIVGGLDLRIVARVSHQEDPTSVEGEVENVTNNFILICRSTPERIAVGIAFVYKGLLQLAAFVLAIHTQRVKVKGLNDAKYIIAAVYASSIGLILATLTHFFAIEYENLHAALFAASAFFSSTAILGLIFIPKMIELYKDPEGENVFVQTYSGGEEMSLGNRGTVQPHKDAQLGSSTEDTLRKRIKQLEDILSTYSGGELTTNGRLSAPSTGEVNNTSSSGNTESSREIHEHVSSLKVID